MKLGPYVLGPTEDENQGVYTGDARILSEAIPDESVDLIFTDPVYQNIDDYRWLAETAARVLKSEGALLCWSNGKWHRDNANWLEQHGLIYRWTFTVVTMDRSAPLNGRIICKANRVLWMDKGLSSLVDYLPDGYSTYSGASRSPLPVVRHCWHKSPQWTILALKAFISELTLDPFVGSGTVPASCQFSGDRHWLAFEIDPATAETARQRIRQTQPPLPGLIVEQMELIKEGQHG